MILTFFFKVVYLKKTTHSEWKFSPRHAVYIKTFLKVHFYPSSIPNFEVTSLISSNSQKRTSKSLHEANYVS